MTKAIVVINSGSTSLKFAAYSAEATASPSLFVGAKSTPWRTRRISRSHDHTGKLLGEHRWEAGHAIDHRFALKFTLSWLESNIPGLKIVAAGHRVVQGGTKYDKPIRVDAESLNYLESLEVVEPSHQPFNVRGMRALAEEYPGLPQVACFDTSFHRTMPEVAQTYAVSAKLRDAGVRHWGYHGISYDYISRQVPKVAPNARRVIVAHLGGGASMCAMLDGRSVETTMGFAGLTGLPMATRSGDIAADALFYVLRRGILDVAGLERSLYHESGLLGLSGTSDDMRVLQDSKDPKAVAAVGVFRLRVDKIHGGLRRRSRRTRRLCLHGRHRRTLRRCARRLVQKARVAWRQARRESE